MVKNHLKRIAMPASWRLGRKERTWVTRPNAGSHSLDRCMSLETMMKELIKCAHSRKEAKSILQGKDVLVDGKRRKELKLPVGLMDVISLPEVSQYYRVLVNNKGEIITIPIKKEEAAVKPCKIIGKTVIGKGIMQINLFDSKNIVLKKGEKADYEVGDTMLLSLPKQEIKDHFKIEKGAYVFLTGGKHVGQSGRIEDSEGNTIRIKLEGGDILETAKKHAFAVGKDKPSITLK